MSRTKRFVRSLLSGYALIGINILYTLASVPLALHYLSKEEFGLWALVTQMAGFNSILVDMGMAGSLSRILIDHKDKKDSPSYGTVIQTGFWVLIVQACLIVLVGSIISLCLPRWMNVPENFWSTFHTLMILQCIASGIGFVGRIFGFILQAHQRYDVGNYSTIISLGCNFSALWVGFQCGLGLYSMVAAVVASTIFGIAFSGASVVRLGFLPSKGHWGRPNWATFRELFSLGTDVFLLSIGHQLITASVVPLVSRTLGLEAAAVWSVATKIFSMAQQLVFRILDFSYSALTEMAVRGERDRFKTRFRDLAMLTGSSAAAVGIALALCNQPFLDLWTNGRIGWSPVNDFLMAFSLFVYSLTRFPMGLITISKQIGAMKFIYFFEGVVFVGMGLILAPHLGIGGIILSGIVTNLSLSGFYGLRRALAYFGTSWSDIFQNSLKRPLQLLSALTLIAAGLWLATRTLTSPMRLLISAGLFVFIMLVLFWRLGLPEHLQKEFSGWIKRRLGSTA